MDNDVFICHASEDKQAVVRPLAAALQREGIRCWVDEGEIQWGDSIVQKVNEGLIASRFTIVVLSEAFIGKHWPRREFNAVLNIEASTGDVRVLPLLVGDSIVRARILREFPLLNDKLYISWEGKPELIVKAVISRLSEKKKVSISADENKSDTVFEGNIPLPKIRKHFSQRDKDLFLTSSFSTIHDYFKRALSQLENHYPDVETDFLDIHPRKFTAQIYVRGDKKCQCKIWIGGLSSIDGINYSENRIDLANDNSFNESISVEEDGYQLQLKPMFGALVTHQGEVPNSQEAVAEMLWRRFTAPLEWQ